jgi:hypothetical protein
MDAAVAGLIGSIDGTIAGGVLGILTSLIQSRSQRALEQAKVEWERKSAVDTELRAHVATVARELLSAQHSMEWICWQVHDGSKILDNKAVDEYHKEIHVTFPKLLGSLAEVSSLDDRAYKELLALADKIFKIDIKIAEALREFKTSSQQASEAVSWQHKEAVSLYRQLPDDISKIMKDIRNVEQIRNA